MDGKCLCMNMHGITNIPVIGISTGSDHGDHGPEPTSVSAFIRYIYSLPPNKLVTVHQLDPSLLLGNSIADMLIVVISSF